MEKVGVPFPSLIVRLVVELARRTVCKAARAEVSRCLSKHALDGPGMVPVVMAIYSGQSTSLW